MFSFSKKLDFMLTTFIKTTKKVKIQNQIKKGKPTFSKNKKIKKIKGVYGSHCIIVIFYASIIM